MGKRNGTPEERFWKKVSKGAPGKCWPWTGALNTWGYARFWVEGTTVVYASRFSYELHRGKIGNGLFVCHHCDNPACVNPGHLFLGTHKDNVADCVRKGRAGSEADCRLQPEKIRGIQADRRAGMGLKQIAHKYGVSVKTVSRWANSSHDRQDSKDG